MTNAHMITARAGRGAYLRQLCRLAELGRGIALER
jgi:hypothetical protein